MPGTLVLGCGTGGWGGPQPGDPDNVATLSAQAGYGGITVRWTWPGTNGNAVAHTRVYRGNSAVFANAALVHTAGGSNYFDPQNNSSTFWYWISFMSIHGTPGAPIGPASATARPMVDDIFQELAGRIDRGYLAIALSAELDQLSIINGNLLNEIFDRETGQTSLAQAIEDAENGIAEAHSFITTETASRVSAVEALAESIDIVAVTLGDDFALVSTSMTARIDGIEGDLGAGYMVRTNVNGLIGGFGIWNDGATVEMGFDVTKFWVGETNAQSGMKPFIIDGGVVYIAKARIKDGDIDNAKIGNAAITTAKIGDAQVDTLKVGGNAITIMKYNTAGTATVVGTVNVLTVSLDMGPGPFGSGGAVIVQGVVNAAHPETGSSVARITRGRDGAILSAGALYPIAGVGTGGAYGQIVMLACDNDPVPGNNNYHIQLVDMTASSTQMSAVGGKR